MNHFRPAPGFSLVEMLVVLALLVLLSGLSLPGFLSLVETEQGEKAVSGLMRAISLARSEAVSRRRLVTLCPSLDGHRCGGSWAAGTLVFSDANGDRELNQGDEILRYLHGYSGNGSLRWRAFQNRHFLQITPMGFTRYQNGNFTWCPADGDARQLVINRTARVRVAIDRDGDGIRENSSGQNLSCP